MQKIYDVVATTGSYKNRDGEEKRRYLNVGVIMKNDKGPFLLLNKTFNPAGLAEPDRESIMLSLFAPRDENQSTPQQKPARQEAFEDDIPF